jgi:AcrR family transcriptional regulator
MTKRDEILAAALRVFIGTGSRGATTRRIAAEAGVNEVTLFRHFGSKEALLAEALRGAGSQVVVHALPCAPERPEEELTAWCGEQLRALVLARDLLRTSLAEHASTPGAEAIAREVPTRVAEALIAYTRRLQETARADESVDPAAATAMLMGALFSDAVSRDLMPACFPIPIEEAAGAYTRLFLRAIGARATPPSSRPPASEDIPESPADREAIPAEGPRRDDQPDLWGGPPW